MGTVIAIFGEVSSRSSIRPGGPPGETEILKLNPQRRELILNHTGWPSLFPGTLNVDCLEEELVAHLDSLEPSFFESPESIVYPAGSYVGIPAMRKGYRYYRGLIGHGTVKLDALFRRAVNPLKGRVGVFGAEKIRTRLKVTDGSRVELIIHKEGS